MWLPHRKGVPLVREGSDFSIREREDAETHLPFAQHPIDQLLAIRRPACESTAGFPVSEHPHPRSVRLDQRNLPGLGRTLKEAADAEGDGLAVRRPAWEGNHLAATLEYVMRFRAVAVHDHHRGSTPP